MKQTQQSGLSSLHIIIMLAALALLFGLLSLFTGPASDQPVVADTAQPAASTDTPIETFAQNQAQDIASPAVDAMMQKDEEIKAEMAADVTVETETQVTAPTPAAKPVTEPEPEPAPAPTVAGTFTDYSAAALVDGETNVLFFHADWCPSCRGLENDLNANLGAIPGNVNILKLDYDSETELKKQYGVIRQHTLVVVDGNGTEIKKLTGLTNTLDQVVNQL